jgi:hypothetical protein
MICVERRERPEGPPFGETADRRGDMAQDWIIDVLADLRQYAARNYHVRLAEQLDDAIVVAAAELHAAETAPDPEAFRDSRGAAATVAPIRPLAAVD